MFQGQSNEIQKNSICTEIDLFIKLIFILVLAVRSYKLHMIIVLIAFSVNVLDAALTTKLRTDEFI